MGHHTDCYSDEAYALSARLSDELPRSFQAEPIHVNTKGGKQSDIRVRFDLLPASATKRVAETLHYGAIKYGENNWHDISTNEHLNHALNHIFVSLDGGHKDDEDLVHAACRLLMAIDRLHYGDL